MAEYNMTSALQGTRNYQNAVDYCLGVSRASRLYVPTDPNECSISCKRNNPSSTDDCSLSCNKHNLIYNEQAKFIQLVVACIFCDHELAWAMSEKLRQFGTTFAGTIWPYICAFYRGMAATSMLHISSGREYVGTVKSCLKELRKGRKKSVSNISHQLYLLEAEYAAFSRKKYVSAEKFYLLAIEYAALSGVTHEHAFACERFGIFHLLRKNHNAAYEQTREAHTLYSKWGEPLICCHHCLVFSVKSYESLNIVLNYSLLLLLQRVAAKM